MDEKIVQLDAIQDNDISNDNISSNGYIPNSHTPKGYLNQNLHHNDITLDFDDSNHLTAAQKCFGEKSDVERVLDNRCPCLQSKCLHLSGSFIFLFTIGLIIVILFRQHLKEFLEWLQDVNGWISGVIFVCMFTLVSFPMTWGYIVLNVACGYLYGFIMGTLTVVISVIIGVTVSIVSCRIFVRDFIQSKLQSEHLKAITRVIESRRGFKVIVLTRLTPIPFGLQNGLFAITNTSIYKCLSASTIGLLPTQGLNAYMGSTLRTMEDVVHHNSAGGYILLSVQVGIGAFLMWYVVRRARYELNKECLPTPYDDALEQLKKESPLSRTHSSQLSSSNISYERLPTDDLEDTISNTNERPSEKIQTHKRAHSASAVLYALQNKDDYL